MADNYESILLRIVKETNDKIGEVHGRINDLRNELQVDIKDRELLEQAFANFVKRMDSKVEDCQTVAQTMVSLGKENKARINSVSTSIGEISGLAAQALNKVNHTENKFNKLWLRIFFAIVGSTLLSQAVLFAAFIVFSKR